MSVNTNDLSYFNRGQVFRSALGKTGTSGMDRFSHGDPFDRAIVGAQSTTQAFSDTVGVTDSIVASTTTVRSTNTSFNGASIFNFWNDFPTRLNLANAIGLDFVRAVNWLNITKTKVAVADNGLTLNQILANHALHVGANFGPASGFISVQTSAGVATLSYSGKTSGVFTISGIFSGTGTATVATNNGVTVTQNDPTSWTYVDQILVKAKSLGLKILLDLSTFRNRLQDLGQNPYTTSWSSFISFVAARVSPNGGTYATDPTISVISFAGEPDPADPNVTRTGLVSFYSTVSAQLRTAFPLALIANGGLLHYAADNSGLIDWQSIFALSTIDLAAVHVYSGVDFGGTAGSGDEGVIPAIGSYCASIGKKWIVEEFGLDQHRSKATWNLNDSARATAITNIYALCYAHGAAGVSYWNDGTEIYYSSSDVAGSYPITNPYSGGIAAYETSIDYKAKDAVSNGGTNWFCFTLNGPNRNDKVVIIPQDLFDPTGVTDISDALSTWLNNNTNVPNGTSASAMTQVLFPPKQSNGLAAVYRIEGGVLGSIILSNMTNVTFDGGGLPGGNGLDGAQFVQLNKNPFSTRTHTATNPRGSVGTATLATSSQLDSGAGLNFVTAGIVAGTDTVEIQPSSDPNTWVTRTITAINVGGNPHVLSYSGASVGPDSSATYIINPNLPWDNFYNATATIANSFTTPRISGGTITDTCYDLASTKTDAMNRIRTFFTVVKGRHVRFRGLQITGSNSTVYEGSAGYDQNHEAQDGIDWQGCIDCEIGDVTLEKMWGNGIESQPFINTDGSYVATIGLWVHDSVFQNFGRQASSLTYGGNFIYENTYLGESARSLVDIEPTTTRIDPALSATVQDVHILNCTIGQHGLGMMSLHESISRLHVANCTGHQIGTSGVAVVDHAIFENNSDDNQSTPSRYDFQRGDTIGGQFLIIRNNHNQAVSSSGVQFHADDAYDSGTSYSDNDIVSNGGIRYKSRSDGNLNHFPASNPTWWINAGATPTCTDYLVTGNDFGGKPQFIDNASTPWTGTAPSFTLPVPAHALRDLTTPTPNLQPPSDATSSYWGKMKTSTFDINQYTNAAFLAVIDAVSTNAIVLGGDIVGVTDAIKKGFLATRTDVVGVTDITTRQVSLHRSVTDIVGISDAESHSAVTAHPPISNDMRYFSRGSAFQSILAPANNRGLEYFSRGKPLQFAVAPKTGLIISDTVGLSDFAGLKTLLARHISDTVGVSDFASLNVIVGIVANDMRYFHHEDAFPSILSKLTNKGLDIFSRGRPLTFNNYALGFRVTVDVTDISGVTDSIHLVRGQHISTSDVVGITDSVVGAQSVAPVITDLAYFGRAGAFQGGNGHLTGLGLDLFSRNRTVPLAERVVSTRLVLDVVGVTDNAVAQKPLAKQNVDVVGITDIRTAISAHPRTRTDVVGVTDVGVFTPAGKKNIVDASGVIDVVSMLLLFNRNGLLDIVGTSDILSSPGARVRPISDSVTIIDTIVAKSVHPKIISDSVVLTDSMLAHSTRVRSVTDLVGCSDSAPAPPVVRVRLISDTVGVTDVSTVISHFSRIVTDVTGVADNVNISTNLARAFTVSDSVVIFDSVGQHNVIQRNVTDTVGLSDILTSRNARIRSDVDAVSLIDSFSGGGASARGIADSVILTDSIHDVVGISKTVVDTVVLTDVISRRGIGDQLTDTSGVSDSAGGLGSRVRIRTDVVGLVDVATKVIHIVQSVADVVFIADQSAINIVSVHQSIFQVIDVLTVTDSLAIGPNIRLRSVVDTVGVTETFSGSNIVNREVFDNTNVNDNILYQKGIQQTISDTVNIVDFIGAFQIDVVGVVDFLIPNIRQTLVLSEEVDIRDDVSNSYGTAQTLLDVIEIEDAPVFLVADSGVLTDIVGITDIFISALFLRPAHHSASLDMQVRANVEQLQVGNIQRKKSMGFMDVRVGTHKSAGFRQGSPSSIRSQPTGHGLTIRAAKDKTNIFDLAIQHKSGIVNFFDSIDIDDFVEWSKLRTIADIIGVMDVLFLGPDIRARDLFDFVDIQESILATSGFNKILSDVVADIFDTIGSPLTISRIRTVLEDVTNIHDSLSARGARIRNTFDSASISDSISGAGPRTRTVTDSVDLTDSLAGQTPRTRPTADVVGIVDAASFSLHTATILTVGVTDTVGVSDSDTFTGTRARTVTDTVGITDSSSLARHLLKPGADTVGVTDSVAIHSPRTRALVDTVGVTDVLTEHVTKIRTVTDIVGASDLLFVLGSRLRLLTDSVVLSDSFTRSGTRPRHIVDVITLVDAVTGQGPRNRIVSDIVGMVDTLSGSTSHIIQQNVIDVVGVTDLYSGHSPRTRSGVDVVGLTDVFTGHATRVRARTDIVGVPDSLVITTVTTGVSVDIVGVTDIASTHSARVRLVTDDLSTLADVVTFQSRRPRSVADVVGISDSVTFTFNVGHVSPQFVRISTFASTGNVGNPTPAAISITAPAIGNRLIALVASDAAITSVASPGWLDIPASKNVDFAEVHQWERKADGSANDLTFSVNMSSATGICIAVLEYANISSNASALDVATAQANIVATPTPSTGNTAVTSLASELVTAGFGKGSGSAWSTVITGGLSNGFTERAVLASTGAGGNAYLHVGTMNTGSTGVQSWIPTWTATQTHVSGTIATFKTGTGSSLTTNPSDVVGVTDNLGERGAHARSGTDVVGVTDAVTFIYQAFGTLHFSRPIADSVVLTDSVAIIRRMQRTINDSVVLTDSATAVPAFFLILKGGAGFLLTKSTGRLLLK